MSKEYKYRRIKDFAYPIVVLSYLCSASAVFAETPFTAKDFLEKMNSDEQFNYLMGAIDALAYARYMKDGKSEDGMTCIVNWFFEGTQGRVQINQAFEEFGDYPPSNILWHLAKKQCGE